MRSVLSLIVPSCCWKIAFSSRGKRSTNGRLRSVLKKNSASARRGRTTFSLPSTMWRGSFDSMFETKMKLGSSFLLAS
ncbi:Uncharacterised protein [Vibrio cholerae]|nr:Uncharacterised protein [Vibrio cholerae]